MHEMCPEIRKRVIITGTCVLFNKNIKQKANKQNCLHNKYKIFKWLNILLNIKKQFPS